LALREIEVRRSLLGARPASSPLAVSCIRRFTRSGEAAPSENRDIGTQRDGFMTRYRRDPAEEITASRARLATRLGTKDLRWVVSPYRICPLGAHIDHQGGPVLGMAITGHTLLAFRESGDGSCRFLSENYPGEVGFDINASNFESWPEASPPWSSYAVGASVLIREKISGCARGVDVCSLGFLPGSGLSSSASVTLGYITALAAVNGVKLEDRERVFLAQRVENEWAGVACGILDPASIVGSRRDHLLSIDTEKASWKTLASADSTPGFRILVAYTGLPRNLAETGFNSRVEECGRAARDIARRAGLEGVARLGDLPADVLEQELGGCEPVLEKRARHFHEERWRVHQGIEAWQLGDLGRLGELMSDSCRSSRENFETGSPELVELNAIMVGCEGVYGARFSGAGFGGSAIGLVAEGMAESAQAAIEKKFIREYPGLAGKFRCYLVDSDDGLRLV